MTALETLNLGRRNGISAACLHPLLILIEDSPQTPTVLAANVGCSTAAITGLCDSLAKGGWITRTPHTQDRRMWLMLPTEKAYELFTPAIEEP